MNVRRLLFSLILTLGAWAPVCSAQVQAQGLPWQWVATQNPAPNATNPLAGPAFTGAAAADAAGNIYTAGEYTSSLTLGGVTHPARGSGDVFIAKYDAQGQLQWSSSGGGPGLETRPAMAVDAAGNSYVAGAFQGAAASFNGVTLPGEPGRFTAFVLKFDGQGTQQWAVTGGRDAVLRAVALGPGGELYAGGWASQSVALSNGQTLGGFASRDAYVLRLDPATGALLSGLRFGGPGEEQASALALDAAGDLYLGGDFTGTAAFGAGSYTARGVTDGFALKCTPAGQVQWAWQLGGLGLDHVARLSLNQAGQLIVAGGYAAHFPTYYDQGTLPVQPGQLEEAFTARLSAQGRTQWVRTAGSTRSDAVTGLLLDAAGNSYVSGCTGAYLSTDGTPAPSTGQVTNGYLISYDAQGGLRTVVQAAQTFPYALVMDAAGVVWTAGAYYSPSAFSPFTAPVTNTSGAGFVARLGRLPLAARAAAALPVRLAPNPAHDQVRVTLPQAAAPATTLQLYNALGQAVRAVPVPPQGRTATLDVQGLARGWYVVRWQSPQGVSTQPLLLE